VFDSQQKSTGTGYTRTVALLATGLIFIPGILAVSRPFGYLALLLAIVCSAVCVVMARLEWRNSSQLTIPSIATDRPRSPRSPNAL